jgi:hypothetical protein
MKKYSTYLWDIRERNHCSECKILQIIQLYLVLRVYLRVERIRLQRRILLFLTGKWPTRTTNSPICKSNITAYKFNWLFVKYIILRIFLNIQTTHRKSNCANDRNINAGKENVPMKAFRPLVSLCVIIPAFPAM